MGPWTSQKEIKCICKVWHHSERGETLKLKSGSSNVTESVTSVKERGGNSLPKLKSSYFGRISQQLCSFVRWRHPIRRDWLAFLPWLGHPYLTTPYHPYLLKRLTQLFKNSGSNITKFQFLGQTPESTEGLEELRWQHGERQHQEVPLHQWGQDAHTFRGFEEQRGGGSLGGGQIFSNFVKYFLKYLIFFISRVLRTL